MLGAVAVGMTFVILTAGIDLSVGMVLSLCSVVAALLYDSGEGYALPVVLLGHIGVGAATEAFNATIIVWRRFAPFIVTLATVAIVTGAALTVSGGKPIGGIKGTYAFTPYEASCIRGRWKRAGGPALGESSVNRSIG